MQSPMAEQGRAGHSGPLHTSSARCFPIAPSAPASPVSAGVATAPYRGQGGDRQTETQEGAHLFSLGVHPRGSAQDDTELSYPTSW